MATSTADHLAEWWPLAACRSADPDLFFPISQSGPAAMQIQRAKAVCARCAVRSQCLRYALAADPLQGVWGGMSEEERRLIRRREQKARARAARRPSFTMSEPEGRGAAWTEERGTSDEGRRCLTGAPRP